MDPTELPPASKFPDYVVYILILVVGALVAIVVVLICVVVYRSRRHKVRQDYPSQNVEHVETNSNTSRPLGSSQSFRHRNPTSVETEGLTGSELEDEPHTWVPQPGVKANQYGPVEADCLLEEYARRELEDDKLFKQEFETIPRAYSQYSTQAMGAKENIKRNRHPTNLVTVYDYNRVHLKPGPNDVDFNDYINANYVTQTNGKKQYILTQAPLRNTQTDFWRMVFDHDVSIIIMLCDIWRSGMELAYQYWPDENSPGRTNRYGTYQVTSVNCRRYADHTVRTFNLINVQLDDEAPRTVVHFHYTAWRQLPDHVYAKVPKVQAQIVKFVEKINAQEKKTGKENVPLIVHCSGGTAESGMYVALDQLTEQLAKEQKVDIYNCVSHLRQQRPNTVHFASQYKYVFHTLLEQHQYGNTEVNVSDLRNQVFKDTTIRGLLDHQFKALNTVPIQGRHATIGLKEEHEGKNNYPDLIIPFDDNLVPVSPRTGDPHTTYINASWVDGYWEKQAYIVTQDPQVQTAPEFWRMVWEHHVSAVVMLTEPMSKLGMSKLQCYHYWPRDDESEVCYDQIVICHEPNEHQECAGYSLRTFTIYKKQPNASKRTIRQFHFHDWPDEDVPTCATSLLDMIAQVRATVLPTNPIAIHCSGGGDRSSVFCAINLVMDQLNDGGKVDIFQTTRLLRHQRAYMIPTIDQLRFNLYYTPAVIISIQAYVGANWVHMSEFEFLWKAVMQYIDTYWTDED